jgi:prolipoprotein diacylglyceryltransferase
VTEFLSGGAFIASLGCSLYFLRFYRRTGDRLFAVFALAFLVFALNRVLLETVNDETATWVYLVRLAAFVAILSAIVDKNTRSP